MNPSSLSLGTEKKLIPGLFQIAAHASDLKFVSMSRKNFLQGQALLSEIMLDPKKLEGILKAIARMEKPAIRRIPKGRFFKKVSLNIAF